MEIHYNRTFTDDMSNFFFSFFKEFYVHHEEIEDCVTAGYNEHYINLHHCNVGHIEVAAYTEHKHI